MNNFGNRLRQARERAGLTRPQLADQAGTTAKQIEAFEKGRDMPRLDQAVQLADLFGVDRILFLFGVVKSSDVARVSADR